MCRIGGGLSIYVRDWPWTVYICVGLAIYICVGLAIYICVGLVVDYLYMCRIASGLSLYV